MSIRKIVSWIKPKKGERMSYDAIFKGSVKGVSCPAAAMAQPGRHVPDGNVESYFKDVFGGTVF
ncbi:MAG: hypothetical protein H6R14_892 [Proteobacteria bacterium]|nr:hypothetical protein [Pseudomonadota bacterium]